LNGQKLFVHGWIYDLSDGLLRFAVRSAGVPARSGRASRPVANRQELVAGRDGRRLRAGRPRSVTDSQLV